MIPGEPERRTQQERLALGIPIPDEVWGPVVSAAGSVGVNVDRILAAAK
jgi:LDH2 family malate/lactate/ureidoglycolate dehydrogenase